jgi:hypothetical protein
MMRILLRALFSTALLLPGAALHAAGNTAALPTGALRDVDPRTLSSGLFLSLAHDGYYGGLGLSRSALAATAAPAKGTPAPVLDARVGPNIPLGPDPAALFSTQRGQAEPHVWRSAANPELLVATFQEGRFAAGGGSLDCGYAVSTDGGITWTRALIPLLTTASGGTYVRATDPVAAVDLEGNIFLGTLGARQSSFSDGGVVLTSRSTDGGHTFGAPVIVAAGSSAHELDKNWLAVNDYPGTPNANRLAVTYTDIAGNNSYDLLASVSDDRGLTWSAPTLLRPHNTLINQATQPFFLPDGSLLVPYITAYNGTTFRIECTRSTDGGRTFAAGASVVVPVVQEWTDPVLRTGSFLITAWVARLSGDVFVTYAGRDGNQHPRVFVTKSSNQGVTWSAPVAASDDNGFDSVFNPAVAVTSDGQSVTVIYYDKRNAPDAANYVDLYSNTSFDGGATWQPGLRLTEYSSDVRSAPLTSQGYMLGDYQGLVPPFSATQPAVAITVDTRSGNPDPLAIRYALAALPGYETWRVAQFSGAEMADPAKSGVTADLDGDGLCNGAEFTHLTNPRQADYGSVYSTAITSTFAGAPPPPSGRGLLVGCRYRLNYGGGVVSKWESSPDGQTWSAAPHSEIPNDFPNVYANSGISQFALPATGGMLFREVFAANTSYSTTAASEVLAVRTDARLVNLSARAQVKTGDSVLIVGFVTAGGDKSMLVRGVGPTLASLGVSTPLANPQLDLNAPGTPPFATVHNDDWSQAAGASAALFARLGAFPMPAASLDAALVPTLAARPYTAILSGVGGGTGIGIVEAYDADATPGAPAGPRLVNLSARGEVGTGDNILIGGFVIAGTQPRRILLRAVGPGLAQFSLGASALPDPVLTLYRQTPSGAQFVATNDDWQVSASSAVPDSQLGAFALTAGSLDSALILTLAPGAYTAQVSGLNGATGLALVEIYDAD